MSLSKEVKEQIGAINYKSCCKSAFLAAVARAKSHNEAADDLPKTDCCKKAYLAGIFFVCGVVTASNGYNLEFVTAHKSLSLDIFSLLHHFSVNAHSGLKNSRFRIYVKEREGVCDTLAAMGASKSMLKVMGLIARRDLRKQTSRQANCDVYNLDKSALASVVQIEAINGVTLADERLIKAAQARLSNPNATYEELKDILGVSKSTVKYRLNKIVQIYKKGHT